MTAREKFKIGDRVKLTESGSRMRVASSRTGTVTGFGERTEGFEFAVRVRTDGNKTAVRFHMGFWEPIAAHPGDKGGSDGR